MSMGLNDKQQPLPTKIIGSYVIAKLSWVFSNHAGDTPSKRKHPHYTQWLQRFKQNCYDINWEVREQAASYMWQVFENLGSERACHEQQGLIKELDDLLEDEEEDVVCGALESALAIIKQLALVSDMSQLERTLVPIFSKLISLYQSCVSEGKSQQKRHSAKVVDKLMEISGKLHQQINDVLANYEQSKQQEMLGTLYEFISDQVMVSCQNYAAMQAQQPKEEAAAITFSEDFDEDSPTVQQKTPKQIQQAVPMALQHFCYNLPGYSILMHVQYFTGIMTPLISRIFEVSTNETILCELLYVLPQTIVHIASDQVRADLLSKMDELMTKAIEDKTIAVIHAILKEVHVLFKEYRAEQVQDQYFESYQVFSTGLAKRAQSSKALAAMQTKDWRVFEGYLSSIKEIVEHVETPSLYFGKSGFMQSLFKCLKKRLNRVNRDQILSIAIQILTKNCNHSLRIDIHKFVTVEIANSIQSQERLTFVQFCQQIVPQISKRYFQESFFQQYALLFYLKNCVVILGQLHKHDEFIKFIKFYLNSNLYGKLLLSAYFMHNQFEFIYRFKNIKFLIRYIYMMIQERQTTVVIALLKAAKDIRMKVEDPPHLIKLENFINGWRSEKVKNSFIRQVYQSIASNPSAFKGAWTYDNQEEAKHFESELLAKEQVQARKEKEEMMTTQTLNQVPSQLRTGKAAASHSLNRTGGNAQSFSRPALSSLSGRTGLGSGMAASNSQNLSTTQQQQTSQQATDFMGKRKVALKYPANFETISQPSTTSGTSLSKWSSQSMQGTPGQNRIKGNNSSLAQRPLIGGPQKEDKKRESAGSVLPMDRPNTLPPIQPKGGSPPVQSQMTGMFSWQIAPGVVVPSENPQTTMSSRNQVGRLQSQDTPLQQVMSKAPKSLNGRKQQSNALIDNLLQSSLSMNKPFQQGVSPMIIPGGRRLPQRKPI